MDLRKHSAISKKTFPKSFFGIKLLRVHFIPSINVSSCLIFCQ